MSREDEIIRMRYDQIIRLHEKINELEDVIARIQYTNLRRDINAKNRMIEIEKLCKGKKDERGTELQDS
jgi:transposase